MCVENKCAHLLDAGLSYPGAACGHVKFPRRRHAISSSAGRGGDKSRAEAKLAPPWLPTNCSAGFPKLARCVSQQRRTNVCLFACASVLFFNQLIQVCSKVTADVVRPSIAISSILFTCSKATCELNMAAQVCC